MSLIFVQLWFTVIAAFGIALVLEDFSEISFTSDAVLSFLYMGVLATFVTTVLLNKFQKDTTPIRASIIYTWEQPAAVVLSILFINEAFNSLQIVGGSLMVLGILYSETFEYFKLRVKRV